MDYTHLLRLAQRYRLLGLLLNTALVVLLYDSYRWLTGAPTYGFLLWNVFLAWVPYAAALLLLAQHTRNPQARWALLPLGALWLLFLPNAPYLITDLMHLATIEAGPQLYNVAYFAACAWVGCMLGVLSLQMVQQVVAQLYGRLWSWLVIAAVSGLCGVGVYLGRVLRWNSWDAVLNPQALLHDVRPHLLSPHFLAVSALYAGLLLIVYLAVPQPQPLSASKT